MSKIDQCAGANTVNKQIQLVEEWLADNDSVSQLELEANVIATREARYAATAANADATYATYAAAANAANASDDGAYYAAYYANAARWVAKYHELIKEPTK